MTMSTVEEAEKAVEMLNGFVSLLLPSSLVFEFVNFSFCCCCVTGLSVVCFLMCKVGDICSG